MAASDAVLLCRGRSVRADAAGKRRLREYLSVFPLVVKAMKRHASSPAMQIAGCYLLAVAASGESRARRPA